MQHVMKKIVLIKYCCLKYSFHFMHLSFSFSKVVKRHFCFGVCVCSYYPQYLPGLGRLQLQVCCLSENDTVNIKPDVAPDTLFTIRNLKEANNGIGEPSEYSYYPKSCMVWSEEFPFVQNWRQYHHYYQKVTVFLPHWGLIHLVFNGCNSVTPHIPSKQAECKKRLF